MGRLAACFIMALCFGRIGISEASMQDQPLPTLYFITRDNASHDTSIWQANLSPNSAQRILSVEFVVPDTPTARFSEHELSEFNEEINRGGFLRSDANTPGVAQALSGVWWLDGNQLLVATRNEVCDRPLRACYGYFEFLTLDIPSTTLTSLLKVDYHNQAVLQWEECTPGTGVYIDQVVPNPVVT